MKGVTVNLNTEDFTQALAQGLPWLQLHFRVHEGTPGPGDLTGACQGGGGIFAATEHPWQRFASS